MRGPSILLALVSSRLLARWKGRGNEWSRPPGVAKYLVALPVHRPSSRRPDPRRARGALQSRRPQDAPCPLEASPRLIGVVAQIAAHQHTLQRRGAEQTIARRYGGAHFFHPARSFIRAQQTAAHRASRQTPGRGERCHGLFVTAALDEQRQPLAPHFEPLAQHAVIYKPTKQAICLAIRSALHSSAAVFFALELRNLLGDDIAALCAVLLVC